MVDELELVRIGRTLSGDSLDPVTATRAAIENSTLFDRVSPSERVGIAVGSRRIAGYSDVVRTLAEAITTSGGVPVLLAAMGSHGGATATGQREVLERNGLDAAALGLELDTSMQTVEIGRTADGDPVHTAQAATDVDSLIVVNRVKPHTAFGGSFGSGLIKMAVVGLGKRRGAEAVHGAGHRHGLGRSILAAFAVVSRWLVLRGGIALVENGTGGLHRVTAVAGADFESVERDLVAEAARLRPDLGFDQIDLLILDRMGKDISGTGMDPWVIGRLMSPYEADPASPRIGSIYVRRLSSGSGGNAHGVGLADFVHQRLAEGIDWAVTRSNAITAGAPQKARLPLVMRSDREAIEAALRVSGCVEPRRARLVWAEDTGRLERIRVSTELAAAITADADWSVLDEPGRLRFSDDGTLLGRWPSNTGPQ